MSSFVEVSNKVSDWFDEILSPEAKQVVKIGAPVVAASTFLLYYGLRAVKHDSVPSATTIPFHPFLGHALPMTAVSQNCELQDLLIREFEASNHRPFCTSLPGGERYVYVGDPVSAQQLFTDKFEELEKGALGKEILFELLGDGIFTADGEIWKRHRKVASKLMTVRSLSDKMFHIFCETSQRMVDSIKGADNLSETPINMQEMFLRVTLDSFVEIAFGVKLGSTESYPENLPFSHAFDRVQEILVRRFFWPFWKIEKTLGVALEKELVQQAAILNDFVRSVITERRKERENVQDETHTEKEFKDLIDWFLSTQDEHGRLSGGELRDITMNFIIAGRDTTGVLCSWTTYEFSRNQDVLRKVREDLDAVEEMTFQNVNNMVYLEAVLWETMRLHAPVPNMIRQALEDVQLKAYPEMIVRRGNLAVVCTHAMGRSDDLWEDPLEFRPERFLTENGKIKVIDPAKLPVFNLAPRMCLGMNLALLEAKVMLMRLLKNFEVDVLFDGNNRPDYIPITHAPVSRMKYGLNCLLTPARK